MGQNETALYLGINRKTAQRWERETGQRFKARPRSEYLAEALQKARAAATKKIDDEWALLGDFTDQQRADITTLRHMGGYSLEAAVATVMAPKVKIRASA
jgi:DNA-binding XRE family transcriptional regulator